MIFHRAKKIRCPDCGQAYRQGEGHPPARCRFNQAVGKLHKFGAEKTADGFPSKLEASVYQTLLLRVEAGEIRDIRRQHQLRFPCGVGWKLDFSFVECATGDTVYCEAKGAEVETYRLKKTMYGGCPYLESAGKLEIWKGTHRNPVLVETISPKIKETA